MCNVLIMQPCISSVRMSKLLQFEGKDALMARSGVQRGPLVKTVPNGCEPPF